MPGSCGGLVVTPDAVAGILTTEDTGTDLVTTGNLAALSIVAGGVTCCSEAVATVGVKYNAQWQNDGAVQYNATVN